MFLLLLGWQALTYQAMDLGYVHLLFRPLSDIALETRPWAKPASSNTPDSIYGSAPRKKKTNTWSLRV